MIKKKVRRPRQYSDEFKNETVQLFYKTGNHTQVADDLGVPESTIRGWIKEFEKNNTKTQEEKPEELDIATLLKENHRLQKELAIAKEEREILKKAAAYFAQHQK